MVATRESAVEQLLAPGWDQLHPYKKWQGAHWRLVSLVELGERSDPRTLPMLEHVTNWLGSRRRLAGVPIMDGRARRCASQEGNAVFVASLLGEAAAVGPLVRCLVEWQWPDGGWNCDRRAAVHHSSFHETVWPLRGLAAYHAATGDEAARAAARRAAELLLRHRLFRSERTGAMIDNEWLHIHWPPYWHYDVLQGLRAVTAVEQAGRHEAAEAVGWLQRRRRDGGWTTTGRRRWRRPASSGSQVEVVDWTGLADTIVTEQASAVLATVPG